ncbi:chitin disaccharide deacetylase [Ornithinibacillus sp. 179-J 7C1 HS]|uniref:chitin disaccharide deacetylase n=1 Tax=Ornithinibacillus sp. 179-J 7C1 HS TaxID=3142384 RepID=UPI0039A3099D
MKLIVNADDFGYTRAVTYGIVDAFKNGIVTSTTMMCNSPHVDHAVEIAKQNPELGVGVHLVLTSGTPLSRNVPSLTDNNGSFYSQHVIFDHAEPEDIEREWTAQIERFLATGLRPTHLDSHHNVHEHDIALPIAISLADKYGVPLRMANNEPTTDITYNAVKRTTFMMREFYGDQVSYETLEGQLRSVSELSENEKVEINCHPAYIDPDLISKSSYVDIRMKEYEILTSDRIKNYLHELGIQLINYRMI